MVQYHKPALRILGDRFRGARRHLGWTQRELSKRSGVSVDQISEIENGRKGKVIQTYWAIARAMRLELNEVFDASKDLTAILDHIDRIYGS